MPHSSEVRLIEKSRRPPRIRPSASLPRCSGFIAVGCFGVPVEQSVFEAREPEEVVLLLEVLDRAMVDRAQVLDTVDRDQVVVGVVQLAGHAVETLEHVELDVARVVAALEQFGDGRLVARFGGADEVVVGDVEPSPGLGELRVRCRR